MAENIEFNLKVVSDNLKKSLEDNIQRAGKLDVALGSAIGSFAGGVAVKGFELLGSAIGNVGALLKKGIAEAEQEEKALNNLANALRRTGEFSNFAIQGFADFSDELARASAFTDDEIISQIALAKSLGATNEQAKQLVAGAANLSVVLGQDLGTSTEQLAKTLSGTAGRLTAFIPELKSLTKEQLLAGEAIDIVNKKFGGAAIGQLSTYSGATNQAGKAFDNLLEAAGNFVVKNPAVISTINLTTSGLIKLAEATTSAAKFFGLGVTPIEEQRAKIAELGQQYNALTDQIKQRNEFAKQAASQGNEERERVYLEQASKLEAQRNAILKERQSIRSSLSKDQSVTSTNKERDLIDQQTVAQREKLNAELLTLDLQLETQRNQLAEEFRVSRITAEQEGQASEIDRQLQFALEQNQIAYQNELAKNELLADAQSQRLANDAAVKKKLLADEKAFGKANVDQSKQDFALQQKFTQGKLDLALSAANLAATIAKDGSREQFLIQKGAAIAQSIVATNLAAAQALAVPPSPNLALAGLAKATGALNTAAIVASTIKGFAGGGVVGGSFTGASGGGDNVMITARKDEMFLNAQQQKNLFDMINSGTMGSGAIIIQVDGREIARAVRNQVDQGFKI
jgi:hypothetical protein